MHASWVTYIRSKSCSKRTIKLLIATAAQECYVYRLLVCPGFCRLPCAWSSWRTVSWKCFCLLHFQSFRIWFLMFVAALCNVQVVRNPCHCRLGWNIFGTHLWRAVYTEVILNSCHTGYRQCLILILCLVKLLSGADDISTICGSFNPKIGGRFLGCKYTVRKDIYGTIDTSRCGFLQYGTPVFPQYWWCLDLWLKVHTVTLSP